MLVKAVLIFELEEEQKQVRRRLKNEDQAVNKPKPVNEFEEELPGVQLPEYEPSSAEVPLPTSSHDLPGIPLTTPSGEQIQVPSKVTGEKEITESIPAKEPKAGSAIEQEPPGTGTAPVPRPAPSPEPRQPAPSPQPKPASPPQPTRPSRPTPLPRATGGPGKPPRDNPPRRQDTIGSYLKRQFSVLTPRVRRQLRKLKRLNLSKEEMDMILEELAYRPEFEQVEIIDQYVKLHGKDEISPKHLTIIRNLKYPDTLKEWIISQIREMPDEDIDDFLKGLVNSQPAST